MRKKNFIKTNSAGFTLIELLVTLSIFAITTGIVMTSQGKFDNSVLLTNTAYDIAITLRQAQTFGVNVKEGASAKFNPYGVVFQTDFDNKRFDLFEDLAGGTKYKYDGSFVCTTSDAECVNSYKIKRGHYIKYICAGTDDADCESNKKTTLNISFVRPNPEAIILANNDTYSVGNLKGFAKIVISSADGTATRSIIVTKVGQIYVKNN
jgi:prepilin-type N-terminal cleavage/methylation domain-containing protein